jgi:hypothetical protein
MALNIQHPVCVVIDTDSGKTDNLLELGKHVNRIDFLGGGDVRVYLEMLIHAKTDAHPIEDALHSIMFEDNVIHHTSNLATKLDVVAKFPGNFSKLTTLIARDFYVSFAFIKALPNLKTLAVRAIDLPENHIFKPCENLRELAFSTQKFKIGNRIVSEVFPNLTSLKMDVSCLYSDLTACAKDAASIRIGSLAKLSRFELLVSCPCPGCDATSPFELDAPNLTSLFLTGRIQLTKNQMAKFKNLATLSLDSVSVDDSAFYIEHSHQIHQKLRCLHLQGSRLVESFPLTKFKNLTELSIKTSNNFDCSRLTGINLKKFAIVRNYRTNKSRADDVPAVFNFGVILGMDLETFIFTPISTQHNYYKHVTYPFADLIEDDEQLIDAVMNMGQNMMVTDSFGDQKLPNIEIVIPRYADNVVEFLSQLQTTIATSNCVTNLNLKVKMPFNFDAQYIIHDFKTMQDTGHIASFTFEIEK